MKRNAHGKLAEAQGLPPACWPNLEPDRASIAPAKRLRGSKSLTPSELINYLGYNSLFALAAFALATNALPAVQSALLPIVNLGYATYIGNHLPEASQNEFLGIRYAAPPVGNNRFRAPQPPSFLGIQNATVAPPICYAVGQPANTTGRSEDCLYLNVYAPSTSIFSEKLPVWVWIHGGAYIDNSNPNYNASKLITAADNKMVFVEFGYRVGPYGFMTSEDVRADGALNAGLLDQRAVLLWIQKHISKFGGDPDQVVLVGPSAGAGSVVMHLISYGGKGYPRGTSGKPLFRGGIGISPGLGTQPEVQQMEWQFDLYLNRTNCTTGRINCLRSLSSAAFQAANLPMALPGRNTTGVSAYGPCVDGEWLQDHAYKLLDSGKYMKVPVLIGDDTNEGSFFAPNASTPAEVASFFKDQAPSLSDEQVASILAQYPLAQNPPVAAHNQYFSVASNAFGEFLFICPGLKVSTLYNSVGVPSWNYRYDVVLPVDIATGWGSYHTSEVRQIFDKVPSIRPGFPPLVADVPIISQALKAYFTNFVRFLNPNGPSSGRNTGVPVPLAWPTFNRTLPRQLFQVSGVSLETVPQAQVDRCAFWHSLASTLGQ